MKTETDELKGEGGGMLEMHNIYPCTQTKKENDGRIRVQKQT